jgi:hypothetical protein
MDMEVSSALRASRGRRLLIDECISADNFGRRQFRASRAALLMMARGAAGSYSLPPDLERANKAARRR